LSPQEYANSRAKLDDMVRLLDDELVMGATKGTKAVAAPAKK
jgi:hypothetical protein